MSQQQQAPTEGVTHVVEPDVGPELTQWDKQAHVTLSVELAGEVIELTAHVDEMQTARELLTKFARGVL
jgi:hypothetical protein